jgi:hypothetical protein
VINLDSDLRATFRRKPAPPDFALNVLARVESRDVFPANVVSRSPRRRVVRWTATAAAIVLLAIGGASVYLRQQRAAEAERVKNDAVLALHIAGEKLALVQRKLQGSHR